MASFAGGGGNPNAAKEAEGEAHMKRAKAMITTSMFKWSKDWLGAGPVFAKAANCFRLAKMNGRAVEALMQAAACSQQAAGWTHSTSWCPDRRHQTSSIP